MTNGTSQGLFLVVAIVIFGIFVVLANTLFGSEGLTNDLKELFENATEQATDNLNSGKGILTSTILNQLITYNGYYRDIRYNETKNEITMTARAVPYYVTVGFPEGMDDTHLEMGKAYKTTGYIYIDGVPVTEDQWTNKNATTYQHEGTFKVDNETGYFEIVQNRTRNNTYILHANIKDKDGSLIDEGSIVTVKDLQIVQEDNLVK